LDVLVAEAHVERHDAEVRIPVGRVGEVGRRVEDDRGVLGGEIHDAAASHTMRTSTSKSSSFVMQAIAPAASTSSTSSEVTEAVRQITLVSGAAVSTAPVASAPFSPGMR